MNKLAILAAVMMISGCSCRCDLAASSNSTSTKDDRASTEVPSIVAVGYNAPYALVAVDDAQLAIVSPAGAVLSRVKLTDARHVTATDHGDTIVLLDGDDAHAIDLRTGRELWKRHGRRIDDMSFGGERVGVADGSGVAILDLATGREIYKHASSAGRVARYDGGGFVFADAQRTWRVDDDGAERWSIALPADTALVTAGRDLVVAIRKDGAYSAIDPRAGAEVAQGQCSNGVTAEVTLRRRTLDGAPSRSVRLCAEDPPDGDLLAVDADQRALYVVGSHVDSHAQLELVERDAIGRVRWKAPWPGLDRTIVLADRDDGQIAAFVKHDGTVRVYDLEKGLLFEHRLAAGDRYVGFSGDCLLISARGAAVCLDRRSGEKRWATATSGRSAALWPLEAGESLLADGNPLTLSRLDASGRRTWQLSLPGDPVLAIPGDLAAWPVLTTGPDDHAPGVGPWMLSPTTGVQVDGPTTRVIDVHAGAIREIRP